MTTNLTTAPARKGVAAHQAQVPDIAHHLTISCGHVPPEANDDAWWDTVPSEPVEAGWWLYVPTHSFASVIGDMPPAVRDILLLARRLGCAYVHIDRDGNQQPELDWWDS